VLPTILLCGARTFLGTESHRSETQPRGRLADPFEHKFSAWLQARLVCAHEDGFARRAHDDVVGRRGADGLHLVLE